MGFTLPILRDWESTRKTLHAYAKVVGSVPRALASPHPRWWHVSLKVSERGLQTDRFHPIENRGVSLQLLMDFHDHAIKIFRNDTLSYQISMCDGLTVQDLAEKIEAHLHKIGISVELEIAIFEGTVVGIYNSTVAEDYFRILTRVEGILKKVLAKLDGDVGIVNVWPHNFDLAFEWFSEALIPSEHQNGASPAQINFGFAPGDITHARPYFYSNPWPFDENLTENSLPSGAQWFQQSWQGSLLAYDTVASDEAFEEKLEEYFLTIYRLASPQLSKSMLSR